MVTRVYRINKTWDGHYGEKIFFDGNIEIDDVVINTVNAEWRSVFYPSLITPLKIAEHIAFNIIVNDLSLSMMDGFANLSDTLVKIISEDYIIEFLMV